MTRPLCRNCGRTIRRVFRDVSFGEQHVARYRHHQSFSEFPDSIEEAKRLTGVQTVLSVTWVTDAERWIKRAVVWDGASFTDPYFCGQGCAMQFGRHQAALGAATDTYTKALLREPVKLRKPDRVKETHKCA
ncbi:MAG: hypothetical protein E5W82_09440 [Mesorhizobium sp.]|nr:MAG: hypothetical protein E5W82_09440 [Mesorhizobium sp.]